jgi:hypothetical protein
MKEKVFRLICVVTQNASVEQAVRLFDSGFFNLLQKHIVNEAH